MPAHDAATHDFTVVKCHNLRPVGGDAALEPVGLPREMPSGGRMPVARYEPADGRSAVVVYRDGSRLLILNRGIEADSFDVGTTDFTVVLRADTLHIYSGGCCRRRRIASGRFENLDATPPAARLSARQVAQVSATIASTRLSMAYASGASLLAADVDRVGALCADAYRRLDAEARAAGLWWMPVLMALRTLDADGREVARTMPQLVCPPGFAPFDGGVEFKSPDDRTLHQQVVIRPVWEVALEVDDAPDDATYTIEVLAAPALQRIDPDAGFDVEMRRRADDTYFCRAMARSSPVGVWPGAPSARADFLERAVGCFDAMATVVKAVTVGGGRPSPRTRVASPLAGSVAGDIRAIRAALKPRATAAGLLPWLDCMHGYAGRLVAAGATAAVMADISVCPFAGYPAEAFAATRSTAAAPWDAVACVTFADGSGSVVTSSGTGGAPLDFNPVVGYPSPEAVSLFLAVRSGGEVRSATFALRPDASRRRAIHVEPGLDAAPLPDVSATLVIPAVTPPAMRHADYIAIESDKAPARCIDASRMGRINALVAARHSQGAWEYGRERFIAFAETGIYSVVVAADGRSASMSLLDSRRCGSRRLVAVAGDVIYAVASGALVEIRGSRVTTMRSGVRADALAWDGTRHELWLIGSATDVEVLAPSTMRRYTIGLPLDPTLTVQVDDTCYVATADACYEVGSEQPLGDTRVVWRARVATGPRPSHMHTLGADIAGRAVRCDLSVSRLYIDRIADAPELLAAISGTLGAPLRRPFVSCGRAFEVALEGTVGPDFIFHRITIE